MSELWKIFSFTRIIILSPRLKFKFEKGQKQPFSGVLQNKCSKTIRNILRKTTEIETFFQERTSLQVFL